MDGALVGNIILGILTTLFGGLNIFQWFTLHSYKRQKAAEADQSEINALKQIIDALQAEVGRLDQRVEEYERRAISDSNRYLQLQQDYYDLKQEFNEYKITHP